MHGLPIFVVDDGSDEATQQVLAALAQQYAEQLTLLRLPVNGGKGAAVMAGLRAARAAGYTHALQIDADGQHDATDVPRFIEARTRRTGRGDSRPPGLRRERAEGASLRPLSDACVGVDRNAVADHSRFDVRLPPLSARRSRATLIDSVQTADAHGLRHRDSGAPLLAARRVPLDSDARHLRDRRRLAFRRAVGQRAHQPQPYAARVRHAVAFADAARAQSDAAPGGGLGGARARRIGAPDEQDWWRIAERGSHLGMSLLALSCKLFGRRFTALWLHPIVAYFLLTGRAAREASSNYFTHLGAAAPHGEHAASGLAVRVSPYAGVRAIGLRQARRVVGPRQHTPTSNSTILRHSKRWSASGKGALVIGAHLGNLEMTRALATHGALRESHRGRLYRNTRGASTACWRRRMASSRGICSKSATSDPRPR